MRSAWRSVATPRATGLLAALLALCLLLAAWQWANHWYETNLIAAERVNADVQISAHASALTSAVNQRIALLQGLYAFTRTTWPDQDDDYAFEVFSSGLYFDAAGLRSLLIAPEGVTRYVYPGFNYDALSGYDILNDPDPQTRADVQRAIHTRKITLSQPGELRQGSFGLVAWRAVFRGTELWGLVSIALDLKTLLADAGLSSQAGGMSLALRDGQGRTFLGSPAVWQLDPILHKIDLPEGQWELAGIPQAGWQKSVQLPMQVFRWGSLLVVGLLAGIVFLTANRQAQLTQAVASRTRQIVAAQQELEQRVQERTGELATLLQVARRVASTLELEPLLAQILDEIKNVVDYDTASIFRLNEERTLVRVSRRGMAHSMNVPDVVSLLDQPQLGQVIDTQRPLIQPEWPETDSTARAISWMGVPLIVKEHAIGLLVLEYHQAHFYTPRHAELALACAQQAAVGIENARLYEQAGRLAALEERQRLARELHDSVAQVLYSIGLGARAARASLGGDPAQVLESLEYVNRLAEAGQVEMRALIFELRPKSLRAEGLVMALKKQAEVLRARHKLEVQIELCPEPPLPLAHKEALYRISQEALHNIIKHARASQVTLKLYQDGSDLRLEIGDNGSGFDPAAIFPGHIGLHSMQERAAQAGGQMEIYSTPGQGTLIVARLPIPAHAPCL